MRFRFNPWIAAASLAAAGLAPASAQDVLAGIEGWQSGDYDAAVRNWRPLADRGDADAQFNLGHAYRLGRGVPQNLGLAEQWYERAARQGHAQAQAAYGLILFQNGRQREAMPWIERAAEAGDPKAVPLPRPLVGSDEPHFSFAGLKSAVLRAKESGRHADADIAASFQQAVVDCLVDRTARAIERAPGATALVVAGGVAANRSIRAAHTKLASARGLPFVAPPLWLCTDNAAMIAWAGALRFEAGLTDPLDAPARARWPLDPDAEKARGAGVKA